MHLPPMSNTHSPLTPTLSPFFHCDVPLQIANARYPTGLSAPVAPDPQGSSAKMPRAGPSRVRRQPTRSAAVQRPAYELEEEESDSDYRSDAVGTDDDDDEEDDLGMSENKEVDNEDDDVAEEET
ncbi:unnamed protein product [Closterium sp. NIES-53]